MDTASTAPADLSAAEPAADVPPIGVASIPTATTSDLSRPPVPVPSLPVPPGPPGADQIQPAGRPTPDAGPLVVTHVPDDPDSGFAPGVAAKLRSYVYLLIDPRTGRPFYLGRGRGDRCFRHLRAARPGSGGGGDPTPGFPVVDRIREVEAAGRAVRIDLLRYGLDPDEARLVEAAAHDLLGLGGVPKAGSQRSSAAEVSARLAKRAKFKRPHQVVLLRVGGPGAAPGYEVARHGWRVGRGWTDPNAPRSPRWAATVAGDTVTAVYRIERWESTGEGDTGTAGGGASVRLPDRFSFVGSPDPELERRYVGKSVAPHTGPGSSGPVTYVWCGPHWVDGPD